MTDEQTTTQNPTQHLTIRPDSGVDDDLTAKERGLLTRCRDEARTAVEGHPTLSVLASLGLGLGIGVLLGWSLGGSGDRRRHAETFGRRMLDSIAEALPESLSSRIHS